MNSNRTNRSWRLRQRPEGIIDENDLEPIKVAVMAAN